MLDLVDDPAVEDAGGLDARLRVGGEHGDPRPRALLECAHASDLCGQRGLDSGSGHAAFEDLACHAVLSEFVEGEVDAPAMQVLADVADEVGELECHAQILGARIGLGCARFEDRHHLQADDRRTAVDVLEEIVVRRIVGDGEIHAHGVQEGLEVLDGDLPGPHRVHESASDGIA